MRNNQSFNQLRRVIRGILSEMPFKRVLPVAKQHLEYDPEEEDSYNFSPSALGKFHSSKRFLKSATHVFADFPQDVYILPVRGNVPSFARVGAMEGEEAISHLEDLARTSEFRDHPITGINIDEIRDVLSQGATVIASFSTQKMSGFLPTPWMIIHAMLDSGGGFQDQEFSAISREIEDILDNSGIDIESSNSPFYKCLTMKSARTGQVGSVNDAAAEIMTQEIGTRRGFYWNMTPDAANQIEAQGESVEDYESVLQEIEDTIKGSGLKDKFISATKAAAGKVIFLDTAGNQDA